MVKKKKNSENVICSIRKFLTCLKFLISEYGIIIFCMIMVIIFCIISIIQGQNGELVGGHHRNLIILPKMFR